MPERHPVHRIGPEPGRSLRPWVSLGADPALSVTYCAGTHDTAEAPGRYSLDVCSLDAEGAAVATRDLLREGFPLPWWPSAYVAQGARSLLVWDDPRLSGIGPRLQVACTSSGRAVSADIRLPAPVGTPNRTFAVNPRLRRIGGTVWLAASSMDARVWVAQATMDAPFEWHLCTTQAPGAYPTVCACPDGRVLLAYTKASGADDGPAYAPHPGPILLCGSEDGETWTEPKPTVPATNAYSPALAYDAAIGLVLVYAAGEREGEWPLYAARSEDFGETWGEPVMLTGPDTRCTHPDALLFDGRLYIAYLEVPKPGPDQGPYALPDPTGLFTMVLDPTELPLPKVEGK